jgi:hypothetical protein
MNPDEKYFVGFNHTKQITHIGELHKNAITQNLL